MNSLQYIMHSFSQSYCPYDCLLLSPFNQGDNLGDGGSATRDGLHLNAQLLRAVANEVLMINSALTLPKFAI